VSRGTQIWIALGAIYVIWGSTYLGIELVGETVPPLFGASTRFVAAGLLMLALATWRRGPGVLRLTRRQLASSILIGLLLPGANALLFIAERHVPTGLASLIIGSVPLWIVVLRTATGDHPPRTALAGVVGGFAGLAILVRPHGGAPLWALLLVLASAITWSVGAFVSSRLPMPTDTFAGSGYEMLAGGLIMLPIALATTDPHPSEFSTRSVLGWVYLVTFGSLIGYTAFTWLLDHAPIGRVATYAYVNPVVAIALGAIVLGESITWTIVGGATIVLACVAVVVRQEEIPIAAPEPETA